MHIYAYAYFKLLAKSLPLVWCHYHTWHNMTDSWNVATAGVSSLVKAKAVRPSRLIAPASSADKCEHTLHRQPTADICFSCSFTLRRCIISGGRHGCGQHASCQISIYLFVFIVVVRIWIVPQPHQSLQSWKSPSTLVSPRLANYPSCSSVPACIPTYMLLYTWWQMTSQDLCFIPWSKVCTQNSSSSLACCRYSVLLCWEIHANARPTYQHDHQQNERKLSSRAMP